MAFSKCGSCGNGFFEMVEEVPSGSNYKQMFIQCSACGVPIGITDYFDTYSKLDELEKKIDVLQRGIETINYNIGIIASRLK